MGTAHGGESGWLEETRCRANERCSHFEESDKDVGKVSRFYSGDNVLVNRDRYR